MTEASPAMALVEQLVAEFGTEADAELDAMLDTMDPADLCALEFDWPGFWARPKQLFPDRRWRSAGFLTGRGFGKTRAIAEWLNAEIEAGRAARIALIAQSEDDGIRLFVDGQSGLVVTARPWFVPSWNQEKRTLAWPNGALATIYTPERPKKLRGPEHDTAWAAEITAWPKTTAAAAFMNLRMGLRKGRGRLVWDATPKGRNAIIRFLLLRAEHDVERHIVVRGSMHENEANLTEEFVSEMVADYGGTTAGDEEISGLQRDDADGALWKSATIKRVPMPVAFARRLLCVDPAISLRRGTDDTGIVDAGLAGGKFIVVADLSDRLAWEAWGELVIDRYLAGRCYCVVVERNRGGDACAANIRACAQLRRIGVEIVKPEETIAVFQHRPDTIVIREVIGRGSKADRARPVVTLYEKDRAAHVEGADLEQLEELMTMWDPEEADDSPNALDAMVHAAWELMDLKREVPDARASVLAAAAASKLIRPVEGLLRPPPRRRL